MNTDARIAREQRVTSRLFLVTLVILVVVIVWEGNGPNQVMLDWRVPNTPMQSRTIDVPADLARGKNLLIIGVPDAVVSPNLHWKPLEFATFETLTRTLGSKDLPFSVSCTVMLDRIQLQAITIKNGADIEFGFDPKWEPELPDGDYAIAYPSRNAYMYLRVCSQCQQIFHYSTGEELQAKSK